MEQKDLQLKNEVLRRVRTVFYIRTVVRPLLVEMILFVGSIIAVCLLVSVPSILANLAHSTTVSHYFSYLVSAFVHTRIAVQILLTLGAAFLALLTKDIIKNLR